MLYKYLIWKFFMPARFMFHVPSLWSRFCEVEAVTFTMFQVARLLILCEHYLTGFFSKSTPLPSPRMPCS